MNLQALGSLVGSRSGCIPPREKGSRGRGPRRGKKHGTLILFGKDRQSVASTSTSDDFSFLVSSGSLHCSSVNRTPSDVHRCPRLRGPGVERWTLALQRLRHLRLATLRPQQLSFTSAAASAASGPSEWKQTLQTLQEAQARTKQTRLFSHRDAKPHQTGSNHDTP